jgi:hypothetical protein
MQRGQEEWCLGRWSDSVAGKGVGVAGEGFNSSSKSSGISESEPFSVKMIAIQERGWEWGREQEVRVMSKHDISFVYDS